MRKVIVPMKLKIRITAFVLTAVICCVLCPSCAKQPAAMTYGKTEITEGMSVSYTHLDVYKRQGISIRTAPAKMSGSILTV